MRCLVLLGLLIGCSNPNHFEGRCFTPFIYSGREIKVLRCSNNIFNTNYCVIKQKRITIFGSKFFTEDTVYFDWIKNSIEVNCQELGF